MSRHSSKTFFQRLYAFDQFFEPLHREIVQWLNSPPGAHIADIGCGAGGLAVLFAQAVGEAGEVAAVEVNDERIGELRTLLEQTLSARNITLHRGELPTLPFPSSQFDLTWCSRVVHHLPDPVVGVRELVRITKSGGRVVLREGGITPRFLPHDIGIGQPGLEERVRVAQNLWFDNMRAGIENRVSYPHGWLTVLREAGLQNVTAKSFLYELVPPFTDAQTIYLRNWLNDAATDEDLALNPDDRDTLRQLCDPASEHYAFRREDLHFLYAASVYVGEVNSD